MRVVFRCFLYAFVPLMTLSASYADDGQVNFNRDIRGILSENCFHCHGPDDEARQADLRLDTQQGAIESAIVAGDPNASDLIDRITSDDVDLLMPPPDSERSLTPQQIKLLKQWIKSGAKYEAHWSFIPPQRPQPPELKNTDHGHNTIDRFVLKPLEAKSLSLAPPADRETLIRRATFDLIGLPPTLEEIDAFLADESDDAFANLIDRLLARNEFGERMASDWLDAARYSDTYGYQVDRDRFVWPWRDWVVKAFNENKPYDQFITEQLAGDLLPNATRDQILATTFNRLHPQKVEGGSVPEEFRAEYVADRSQTVGTAMMGLTLECCRCHSHKYDPISHHEYYQFSAFFDNIDEAGLYSYFTSDAIPTPTLVLPTPQQEKQINTTRVAVEKAQQAYHAALDEAEQGDLGEVKQQDHPEGHFAKPIASLDFQTVKGRNQSVQGINGQAVRLTGDDPVNTKVGNFRRFAPFSVSLWMKTPDTKDRAVVFHRSRAWTDAASRGYQLLIEDGKLSWSLIHFWPGNAMRVRMVETIPVGSWVHVSVTNDGSCRAAGLQIFVNGKPVETEVVRDKLTKQITGGGGDNIAIGQRFRDNGFTFGLVDDFHVFDVQLTPLEALRLAKYQHTLPLAIQNDAKMQSQHHAFRHNVVVLQKRAELYKAREAYCKAIDAQKEIMVMRELETPRQTYLLQRGAYDNRGDKVQPQTPRALPAFPDEAPRNRLGLAMWMTSPDHPLTSRVAANRLWQVCFGTGLVRTPEDFGSQGRTPTHPKLLDWLATDLMDNDWDIKRSVKQIMMSATYQQSSLADAELVQADPENEWLARFPTYRLSAEMLRDSCLAISGRLVNTIGGPPVKPYEVEASFKPAKRDKGDGLYRRSLYTYWKRTGPAPMMMALDAAKRDVCRVQRERTSSPLQAFVLLNGPQFVESARGLAETLVLKHGDQNDKILGDAFRQLTSRKASEDELAVLRGLYQKQIDYFQANDEQIKSFLAVGDAKPNENCDQAQLAATTVVIGTLFNYDESVMKR